MISIQRKLKVNFKVIYEILKKLLFFRSNGQTLFKYM